MERNSDFISILQLSDSHIMRMPEGRLLGIETERYFHACLKQAFAENHRFDLILFTGDLAQEPCTETYRRILETLQAYKTPCICLPGNHDDYDQMLQVLNTDSINCRKQVLCHSWQLIGLNSRIPGEAGGRLSEEELDFLANCLREQPERKALIAVHHHVLSTDSPWMDTMMIENSRELLALVDKFPQVKAITNGHIHQVMDARTGSVRILGAPSTCFQFTPETPAFSVDNTAPGYRLLELYADGRVETKVARLPEPLTGLKPTTDGY